MACKNKSHFINDLSNNLFSLNDYPNKSEILFSKGLILVIYFQMKKNAVLAEGQFFIESGVKQWLNRNRV